MVVRVIILVLFMAVVRYFMLAIKSRTINIILSVFISVMLIIYSKVFLELSLSDLGLVLNKKTLLLIFGFIFIVATLVSIARYNNKNKPTIEFDKALRYKLFAELPIQTVLLEEIAFRGVILGYLLNNVSQFVAVIFAAVLFGLWHLSTNNHRQIIIFNKPIQRGLVLIDIVVTTIGGVIFGLIRILTGSIAFGLILHFAINAGGLLYGKRFVNTKESARIKANKKD